MSGKGVITTKPRRTLRLIVALQIVWLVTVCLLGGWWTRVVYHQADQIAALEEKLGISGNQTHIQWQKTQRMMFWESTAFVVLLLGISGLLFGLTVRDVKRTRSLQAFFASISHQLRTPLTGIRLQAESLQILSHQPQPAQDHMGHDTESSAMIQRLLEDATRLETQVDRMLELARLEGGGSTASHRIKIKPLLDALANDFFSGYGERLVLRLELQDVTIRGDRWAVPLIIKNVIENAIRHAGRDTVTVRVTSRANSNWSVLSIQDNGKGFSGNPTQLGKLFHKGTASQGTGVGLYVVKRLMKHMGGRATFHTVDSSPNGFQVCLWFRRVEPLTNDAGMEDHRG